MTTFFVVIGITACWAFVVWLTGKLYELFRDVRYELGRIEELEGELATLRGVLEELGTKFDYKRVNTINGTGKSAEQASK